MLMENFAGTKKYYFFLQGLNKILDIYRDHLLN